MVGVELPHPDETASATIAVMNVRIGLLRLRVTIRQKDRMLGAFAATFFGRFQGLGRFE